MIFAKRAGGTFPRAVASISATAIALIGRAAAKGITRDSTIPLMSTESSTNGGAAVRGQIGSRVPNSFGALTRYSQIFRRTQSPGTNGSQKRRPHDHQRHSIPHRPRHPHGSPWEARY